MFSKKGLSDIVSTVLIVLLALAAVAIVWGFVSPAIRQSGVSVQRSDLCLSVEVLPIRCEYVQNAPNDFSLTNVLVKHSQGDVTELKAILTFSDGTTEIQSLATTGLLSTQNFASVFGTSGTVSKEPTGLETAAVITGEDGELFTCPQISSKLDCEEAAEGALTFCGDGVIQHPNDDGVDEQCDGNSRSCNTSTGYSGTQSCNSLCNGFTTCSSTESCGDGIRNGAEICDGTSYGTFDFTAYCISQGQCTLEEGILPECNSGCAAFDTIPCVGTFGIDC